MNAFLLALQFLTVLTLRSGLRAEPGDLARARSWFWLVGALMGLALAFSAWVLACWLPPLALAGVMVLIWGALSRFLHLDGLADTADGLVYTAGRDRTLEIMKDTRLGAFGLCAVVGVLLVKFGGMASMEPDRLIRALFIAPVLGRALAAGLSVILPPAKPRNGLGAAASGQGLFPLFASAAGAVAMAGLAGGLAGLYAACFVLALGVLLGLWFKRRLGGVTGDTLGAAIEAAEALTLVVLAGAWVS